jgi:uncharacterized protein (TIGR00255 family)
MTPPGPSNSLKSMTGYAQARAEKDGWVIRVSLRSVNHRFLDIHFRLPDGFEPLESSMRRRLRERLRRGHVDLTLHFERAGAAAAEINREVAAAYLESAESLRRQYEIQSEPDVATILALPGVIATPGAAIEHEIERLGPAVEDCLCHALDLLDQMRELEGRHLAQDLRVHLQAVGDHVSRMEPLLERARPAFAARLETRLKELLAQAAPDPARIAQEAAIAAERSDTSEEISRLRSHLHQFAALLDGGAEAGKKLDFLLQEMQREANTLLSKTPGVQEEGIEITRLGLEVKSEIEKLREQVQNLE